MRVKFNDPDEFMAELTADRGIVERNIVRLTTRTQTNGSMPLWAYFVLATYLANGHVVELSKWMGNAMTGEREPGLAANALIEDLSKRISDLGFEIRAGVYELPVPKK